MTTSSTTFDTWIIATDGQTLSIRQSKKMAIIAALAGGLFVVVAVGMACKMLTSPSSDWTFNSKRTGPMYPLREHSVGDQIATYAFVILFWGTFFIAGSAAAATSARSLLVFWLFDKQAGIATRGKHQWPLDQVRAVHLHADTILEWPVAVSVRIQLSSGNRLTILRAVITRGTTLLHQQARLEPIARQIANWLTVPLEYD